MHRVVPLSTPRVRLSTDRHSRAALAMSYAIVVVAPTLLWSGLIYGGTLWAFATKLSVVPMVLIATALAVVLTLIWALIANGRSDQ